MEIEQKETYKRIMGMYPTGVTIVTTTDKDGKPYGFTVNSFSSVSLEPTLVSWGIDKRAGTFEIFQCTDRFAVNILSGDQKEECSMFANKNEKDRFGKVKWSISNNKLPILENTYATLECKKVQQIEAGDHIILIGEVIELSKNNENPMLYFNRNFGSVPVLY